ncbi:hypothetical protein [Actinoplanes sp. NPDC049599]|uniref:hypothetical protein n=1 Tax=Actinoplanes sp. NPDC049599 TaxID=3363903 RepID=UPI0037B67BB2
MRNVTSNHRPLIRTAALGLILTVSWMLTGCGDSGGSTDGIASGGGTGATAAPSASAATNDPARWTKCLRDNGIDVKDPEAGGGTVQLPPDSPALTAAMNKCKQYSAGQSGSTGLDPSDPQEAAQRLKFAKCMRDQGVDWPDPVPGQPMQVKQTPELAAAFQKCMQQVPVDGSK